MERIELKFNLDDHLMRINDDELMLIDGGRGDEGDGGNDNCTFNGCYFGNVTGNAVNVVKNVFTNVSTGVSQASGAVRDFFESR